MDLNYHICEYFLQDSIGGAVDTERKRMGLLYGVSQPTLTVYYPDEPREIALMLVPGGGYAFEAIDLEGHFFAQWLVGLGVTVGVLKYRMPESGRKVPFEDFDTGFALFSRHASQSGISKDRIGVCCFSAGAHLAVSCINRASEEQRPGFVAMFYPLLSMEEGLCHPGSLRKLLGVSPGDEERRVYSPIRSIDEAFPRAIVFVCEDDKSVSPENSHLLIDCLNRFKVQSLLIEYLSGGHGWGFSENFDFHENMKCVFRDWLFSLR